MIKLYLTQGEIAEAAKLAVHHRLYVSGWLLHDRLESLYDGYNHPYAKCHGIALYINEGIPIGICIMWNHYWGECECNFFVREMYRRQGIAKRLFVELKNTLDENDKRTIRFYRGNDASECLFGRLMKDYSDTYYAKTGGW